MATPTWLKPKFSNLEDCVNVTEQISTNFGGECSDEEFSKMTGISSNSSYLNLKLNSIRAYGFVDYRNGRIKLTPLGEKVATPTDADDRSTALLTALVNLPVFKNLSERYRGKTEPDNRKFVENALATEGKIKKEDASEWAACFIESARFAGLFRAKGFLDGPKIVSQTVTIPTDRVIPEQMNEEMKAGWLTYPVPVQGGMARIVVPEDLSRAAWEKLRKLLDAIEPSKET